MATARDKLSSFLQRANLASRETELVKVFSQEIDVSRTVELHKDLFADILAYMDAHIRSEALALDASADLWVPCRYINYIFHNDKSLSKRLGRFTEGLTTRTYRQLHIDEVIALGRGNIGLQFLSWDMTLMFFLQESNYVDDKTSGSAQLQDCLPALLINEATIVEEVQDLQVEAALAVQALPEVDLSPVEDTPMHFQETDALLSDMDVRLLHPVIINGLEYVFLDDIQKALGLREDEALSILASLASTDIDHDDYSLRKGLSYSSYGDDDKGIEEVVAHALLAIKEAAPAISEEEFERIQSTIQKSSTDVPASSSSASQHGSIDISREQVAEKDKEYVEAFEIDVFSARRGSTRHAFGRDAALSYYLGQIPPDVLIVFHTDFADIAQEELLKAKALSKILCIDPLTRNANKVLLVLRSHAIMTFASNFESKILASTTKAENVSDIVKVLDSAPSIREKRKAEAMAILEAKRQK